MRNTIKYLPVILLGTALGGCSMAGSGDYFADEYAQMQRQQMPHYYGAQKAPHGYAVTPDTHAYGTSVAGHAAHGQPAYAQPAYGHAAHGNPAYGVPAYAQSRHSNPGRGLRQAYTYGELGAVAYDVDSDFFGGLVRLGYQSKSIFGAEVEGTLGFTDDEETLVTAAGTSSDSTKIDNSIAGFGLARIPVSQKFNVLGRVGYHNTEVSTEATDIAGVVTETDFSTDGLAYGIGAEYALSPRTSIRADYTIYDYDGPDADAISLAVSRKF